MGVWGTGLYSSDLAADLRAAAGVVLRVPGTGDQLLNLLRDHFPGIADDPTNGDHTTFWLVVADCFAKKGVVCERARARALEIVDGGEDDRLMRALGMGDTDLQKRATALFKVAATLRTPCAEKQRPKPRAVLPPVFDVGDCIVFPTFAGDCFDPRMAAPPDAPWRPDGWGAAVVWQRQLVFDTFWWYRVVGVSKVWTDRPSLKDLLDVPVSVFWDTSVCSASQYKRAGFEKLGSVAIDAAVVTAMVRRKRYNDLDGVVFDVPTASRMSWMARQQSVVPPGMMDPDPGPWFLRGLLAKVA